MSNSIQFGQEAKAATIDFLAWNGAPDPPEAQRARLYFDINDKALHAIDSDGIEIFNSSISGGAVSSVFGRTGDVAAQDSDYAAFYVDLNPTFDQVIAGSNSLTYGSAILTAVAPTVGAGQVGLGSTTAATATAGGGQAALATVAGYLIVNIAGTARKIPYFAT